MKTSLRILAGAAVAAGFWAATFVNAPEADPPANPCPPPETDQVWIPGGTFRFGSDGAYPEEAPAHDVTVAGFWMDRHEVTNARFARFVEETGYVTVAERKPDPADYPDIDPEKLVPGSAVFSQASDGTSGWGFVAGAYWRQPGGPGTSIEGKEHLPVVHVAYEDARAYADWAGRDLPSEAEWEFAARGGRLPTPGDDGPSADVGPDGQYLGNTWQGLFPTVNEAKDGYAELAPVGCFPQNGFGLHDMTGNAWEWTSSWYRPGHRHEADEGYDDPRQPGVPVRVIKGGSYLCAQNFCWRYRATARQAQDAGFSSGHLGFRTVSRRAE